MAAPRRHLVRPDGAGRDVLFAGFGRYYDRMLYNSGLDERFRLQYALRTFRSRRRRTRDGQQTIVWDPSYLSQAGLDSLIATTSRRTPKCS